MEKLMDVVNKLDSGKLQCLSTLQKVSLDLDVEREQRTDSDGHVFVLYIAEIDRQKYRVPITVMRQIKELKKIIPQLKYFIVKKQGEGIQTQYIVLPQIE